jgi:hypothetical protein
MNADFDVAFVAFELKDGTLPSPEDSVAFTLHVDRDE